MSLPSCSRIVPFEMVYTVSIPAKIFGPLATELSGISQSDQEIDRVHTQALRSARNPGSAHKGDRQSIVYQDFPLHEDNGGVHHEAGVLTQIFYQLCNQTTGEDAHSQVQTIGHIWFKTLCHLEEPYTFEHFGNMMIEHSKLDPRLSQQQKNMIDHIWTHSLAFALNP